MWLNWLPWRYIVRRVARARGFVDPVALLSRLHRFAQPSEVAAPLELLRAGVVFHARGLMNTGAIQHNLDWIWPYWVERQFDPSDDAFIPRAFSITHVNLTHRNWTAVGLPDCDLLPLVDPRGLLTPHWDGWSLDAWVVCDEGRELLPSRIPSARQRLEFAEGSGLAVVTESANEGMYLTSRAEVVQDDAGAPICLQNFVARSDRLGWLVVSLRPANPEGVTFIHDIALSEDGRRWQVEKDSSVEFGVPVEHHRMSTYRRGDVHTRLLSGADERRVSCDVGMATAAAMFQIEPGKPRHIAVRVPLQPGATDDSAVNDTCSVISNWSDELAAHTRLEVPDARFRFLYDAAIRTLILHSPKDVYPGPYTYKRFWYRDAAFILYAMICSGLTARARRTLDRFPLRQTRNGYFRSQEGEWDSNGEALWIMERYCTLTGESPPHAWRKPVVRGADWIINKLLPETPGVVHAGLLPSGFSAEHLGPNDYYYWDDFWGAAGLRSAARLMLSWGDRRAAERFDARASRLLAAVDRSLEATLQQRDRPGIPASPYRRMDAGAIGSVAASYPLQLWAPDDPRLLDTLDYLVNKCFFRSGFFQDMIHSGINAYLTLHVAQAQLRAGDPVFWEHVQAVADLASETGQWPEAIHPRTLGGCMGDGQHVWAAAEWVLMMRHCFLREEGERLIIASGIPSSWLDQSEKIRFGPAATAFGTLTVEVVPEADRFAVRWDGPWRTLPAAVEVRLPGFETVVVSPERRQVVFDRSAISATTAAEFQEKA